MPARIDRIALRALACLLPCLVPCFVLAQTPQWPSTQDIDRALKANPFPDANRIGSQPIPQPPRVEPQRSAIDIEALERGKAPLPNAGATSGAAPTPLRISFPQLVHLRLPLSCSHSTCDTHSMRAGSPRWRCLPATRFPRMAQAMP